MVESRPGWRIWSFRGRDVMRTTLKFAYLADLFVNQWTNRYPPTGNFIIHSSALVAFPGSEPVIKATLLFKGLS